MRDRAERAGGWLQIASAPGTGTTVRSWIPAQIGGTR
jgi:signal transduction histidine kinase